MFSNPLRWDDSHIWSLVWLGSGLDMWMSVLHPQGFLIIKHQWKPWWTDRMEEFTCHAPIRRSSLDHRNGKTSLLLMQLRANVSEAFHMVRLQCNEGEPSMEWECHQWTYMHMSIGGDKWSASEFDRVNGNGFRILNKTNSLTHHVWHEVQHNFQIMCYMQFWTHFGHHIFNTCTLLSECLPIQTEGKVGWCMIKVAHCTTTMQISHGRSNCETYKVYSSIVSPPVSPQIKSVDDDEKGQNTISTSSRVLV